ncbi:hypothetical protein [Microcoleus sp. bin38.metabat.b11b12b14.051]|uniref:hypothetical protein n=1 Tax=Microcoleus sp. bin38.metabat.b11b12b14.051 TaxID=2742709 RepID=UPI0025E165F2|nr:hypothetical protein [Microcoleus sp. bin38.metabat.b11b12b14.051]
MAAPKRPKPRTPGSGKPRGDNDPTDFSRFERIITNEVNKREAPTYIEGEKISSNLEDRSYFDVYEFDFGRLDDEPPLIIAGNDAQIALQASLLRAIDQLLTVRGFGYFNFAEWAKQFELGFDKFESAESRTAAKKKDKEVWPGISRENRPKIVELKPVAKVDSDYFDYKVVRFFPNRQNKEDWNIFTGSYREIAQQIINWWNQKSDGAGSSSQPRLTSDISRLSKHPYISLHFREDINSGRTTGTPLESEISFRLMDQQEYDGLIPGANAISIADIKRYAKSVERIFNNAPDRPYTIARGRGSYTYNNWPLGYKLWLLANSASEAEKVFKDVLKIQNHTFDEIYMGVGASRNPTKKYPIVQPKRKVLNQEKALPNQRQTGKVTFRYAKLVLPMTKDSLVLTSRAPRMKVDERLN